MKLKMSSDDLVIKIKFMEGRDCEKEDGRRLRIRFFKERGDIIKWYEVL